MKTLKPLCTGLLLLLAAMNAQAALPVATTLSAGSITTNSANLQGQVNPKSASTKVFFEWGLTTNYGNITATQTLASGSVAVMVQRAITNLVPGTTYHFRVRASNSNGQAVGTNNTFVSVALPPSVTTGSADGVTFGMAILHGSINPNGFAASGYFQWGSTTNYGNNTPVQSVGGGTNLVPVQQVLSNLAVGSYHFRIVGTNQFVTSFGNDLSFTIVPPPLPTAVTENASDVTTAQATLHGSINPNGLAASGYFEWGTSTNYENSTLAQLVGDGTTVVPVQQLISGLMPGTNYHFRMVASNSVGVRYGSNMTFAAVAAPLAVTQPATALPGMSASLHGTVNPNALETTVTFEWGLTTSYGNVTPTTVLSAGITNVPVQMLLSNLASGGPYHFRVRATNSAGTSAGADASFLIPCEGNNLIAVLPDCDETSLRAAIASASRVVFACNGTITLTNPITVACVLVLDGSGQNVTLSGGGVTRLFNVLPGASLTLLNLTLTNGLVRGTNGLNAVSSGSGIAQAGESAEGGGVLVSNAMVVARNCSFIYCRAIGGDGGNAAGFPPIGGASGSGTGGAISARSSAVTLSNCLFSGSAASDGLAGVSYAFANGNVQRASSGGSSGGAVSALEGTTVITNCEFRGNSAGTGGAVEITGLTSLTHIDRTKFVSNSAGGYGGAMDVNGSNSLTTVNRSDFIGNGAGNSGGALVMQSGSLSVSESTFWKNQATGGGSAVRGGAMAILSGDAALVDCDFATNACRGVNGNYGTAGYGGALAVIGGATQISRSTFRLNAVYGGNAVSQSPYNGTPQPALGGAIYNAAALRLTNCTLALNSAYPGHVGTAYSAIAAGGAVAMQGGSLVLAPPPLRATG